MILDRIPILRVLFPSPDLGDPRMTRLAARGARRAAAAHARRWTEAARREPRLVTDLIAIGGLLALRPVRFEDGIEAPDPIDPCRLAYEAGRRDMAVSLIALMGITPDDLNELTTEARDED